VGEEVGLRIDQTLTQDATGTMVMLELEALGLGRARTEVSAQYVDHSLLQTDFKNPDDHLFLHSACKRFGILFSPPGNGVSQAVHMERFGIPGKSLLGSDSHTCAAGAMGMLAMGAGGIEVSGLSFGDGPSRHRQHGAELGATASVFPSDQTLRTFPRDQGREQDWIELKADRGCSYDGPQLCHRLPVAAA
jgi:aconitase A